LQNLSAGHDIENKNWIFGVIQRSIIDNEVIHME
jgi:hypothetical protein